MTITCIVAMTGCPLPTTHLGPPNVILVSLDTLRADHLGCYGFERNTSPAIDLFANESVVFLNAIAQSSHTSASHISLFQSRYPSAIQDSASHLAEVFGQAGYETAAFTGGGKLSAESKFGFDRGFERYEEIREGFSKSAPMIEDWLRSTPRQPYFLFIHTYDIHSPYDPGPPYDTMYFAEYDGPVVPERTREYLLQLLGMDVGGDEGTEILWEGDDRRKMEALYDGGINYADHYLGRLIEYLGQSDAWDWEKDILVIMSDHGEEFWDHGSVAHGRTLYQELVRVPLILRLPGGRAAGTRISGTVPLMDLGPTLLDLAGLEKPSTFWGDSLMSVIEGNGKSINDTIISQTTGVKAIIEYPWKLILYNEKGTAALFNLEEDPQEFKPLQEQKPEMVEMLRNRLRAVVKNEPVPALFVESEEIEDDELREQLRVLGYVQ